MPTGPTKKKEETETEETETEETDDGGVKKIPDNRCNHLQELDGEDPDMGTPSDRGGKRTRKRKKQKGGHHLYKRLGVSKYSSKKQIRKAYNTLKKKRKATKKVKEAYKILSNKKTRKQYNNKYKKMKRKRKKK